MKKSKDLKVGDAVSIYYQGYQKKFYNKIGIITEIVGYKSTVLIDGMLESWAIADLKKMSAAKEMREMYNESR